MEYQATAKYLRRSPRKIREVAPLVVGKPVASALSHLRLLPKFGAVDLIGVLESAVANAKQKKAKEEQLRIKKIEVMGGPVMKRWHAVARGSAHSYKKRMTHVRVILTDEILKENK